MTVAVSIAVLAWWGASADPGRRRALRPVALGVVLSTIGDALYYLALEAQGSVPDASVADIAWIGAYLALLLAWVVAIAPTLADDTLPLSTRLVWSLYPAPDAALLALLVRTVATRRHRGVLVLLIAAGVACWLAADLAYLATGLAAGYSIWLDA